MTNQQAKQVSIIILISVAVLNVAFYFLSQLYFADRAALHGMASAEHIMQTRISFAIMTVAIAAAAIAAQFSPRVVGHLLAIMVGVVAVAGSLGAFVDEYHVVLPVSLLVLGGVILWLAYLSAAKRSRAAWAFLTATAAVGGAVMLFGSTKVRNAMDIDLYLALIIPGILAVTTIALITIADDYAET